MIDLPGPSEILSGTRGINLYTPQLDLVCRIPADQVRGFLGLRGLAARWRRQSDCEMVVFPGAHEELLVRVEQGLVEVVSRPGSLKRLLREGKEGVYRLVRQRRVQVTPTSFMRGMERLAAELRNAEVSLPAGFYGADWLFGIRPRSEAG